ncbi:MAG: CYTH domain-containing protein [Elusimicrobium sp.]|jgi:inorganic triphosphatase YgiF|nr:CYTH domain-containing protein [Elusimicrobium sp.]
MEREYEFKWAAKTPRDFKIFLGALRGLARAGRPARRGIKDIYFDSAAKYYSENKISCRLRRENKKFILTLKGASEIVGGLASRGEKNFRLKSVNAAAAKKEMLQFLPDKNIKKIFTVTNKRTVYKIKKSFEAEICFDDFFINAGGRKRRMFEIEMELKKGRKNIFKNFARRIAGKINLKFAKISKVKTALSML